MSGALDRALRRRSHREAGRFENRTSGAFEPWRGRRASHGILEPPGAREIGRQGGCLGVLLLALVGLILLFAHGMGCSFSRIDAFSSTRPNVPAILPAQKVTPSK
jgi:hypothetical protein